MTDKQPEALWLADAITHPDGEPPWETCVAAAAELRRQCEHIMGLEGDMSLMDALAESVVEECNSQAARITELEAAARQALEALELYHGKALDTYASRAITALREALEGSK